VDLYAVGAIAYELLHGGPPFQGANRAGTERRALAGDISFDARCSDDAQVRR